MPINKADLDQFLNQAKVKLVGAADAGLRGEFYDVVSEFLNDTSIWTQDVAFVAQPSVQSYALSVNEGQIVRLVGVVNWGTVVPTLNVPTPAGATFVPALMPEIGTVALANAFNTTTNLLATFVTNVAQPTVKHGLPQAPSWLLPIWHVGLLDGLLGKMMATPNRPYSNDKQSAYHLRRFRDAIGRARVSKLRANTVGSQAWRFPQQFRTISQQGGVPAVGGANERSF